VARKTKKKIKSIQPNIDISKIIAYFLTTLISLGIIFNGYFFEYQSLTVNILTGAFFALVLVIHWKKNLPFYYDKKFLLLGFTFLCLNLIGLFFASNLREAIGNVLLIFNALLVFFLSIQSFQNKENVLILLKGIYWTSVAIAGIAIFSYIFGINLLNSYEGNRLFTNLGYPNTAALMLVMSFIIGLFMQEQTNIKKHLYYFYNSLLFLAFLATKSRGVFLLFPLLIFLYIILLNSQERFDSIKKISLILIPSIIIFPFFYNGNFENRTSRDIIISILSLLVLSLIFFLFGRIKVNKKILLYSTVFIIFICIGVSVYLLNQDIETLANNDILDRLRRINLQEQSVQERFIFMGDALKIVKDNLLLGVGGGGWDAEYRRYRTFLYFTTEVHNHYLQVMVENGLLGFFVYIFIWILLLYNLYKRITENKRLVNKTIFILVISIFLHSFIDFDLTYPLFYFLLWIFIGISIKEEQLVKLDVNQVKTIYIVEFIIIIFIIANSSLWFGWAYGSDATKQMQRNNISRAIVKYEKSIIFDPVNPTYLTNLSQLYFALGVTENDETYKEKALETINRSIKYNPTNFEWYIVKTRFLINVGKYKEAFKTAQKAISMAPLEEITYYDIASFFAIKASQDSEAKTYALDIINMAKAKTIQIDEKYLKWWHGKLPYSDRLKELEQKLK
jgi:O-antigen ligase